MDFVPFPLSPSRQSRTCGFRKRLESFLRDKFDQRCEMDKHHNELATTHKEVEAEDQYQACGDEFKGMLLASGNGSFELIDPDY